MHAEELRRAAARGVRAPRGLDDLAREDVLDLRANVRLDELERRGRAELLRELGERREPALERGRARGAARVRVRGVDARGDAAALAVADDDDVLDAEVRDRVGEHGEDAVVVQVHLAVAGAASVREREGRRVGTYFAMLRVTKISPGLQAATTLSGTRESAQPIHRTCECGQHGVSGGCSSPWGNAISLRTGSPQGSDKDSL